MKSFMRRADDLLAEMHGTLLAWCHLGNRSHLLVSTSPGSLKKPKHRLQTGHAGYFNGVHRHDGALFGGSIASTVAMPYTWIQSLFSECSVGSGNIRSFHAAGHIDEGCPDIEELPKHSIGDEEARTVSRAGRG